MLTRSFKPSVIVMTGLVACVTVACDVPEAGSATSTDLRPWWEQEGLPPPSHVDSLFSIEEELRRFRMGLGEVAELAGGAPSRDGLVDTFIEALESANAFRLAGLVMTRAEFAWVYYPHSWNTQPPYDLPPDLLWSHQQNYSSRGLSRLLQRYGGRTLHSTGHRCPDEDGEPLGPGRIWTGCTVIGKLPTGEEVEERLFGGIVEFGGRFKLLSFANQL
ncbi:MAG: hypothetical protein WEG36_07990 [Gemmatimonadota bacterium]